MTYFFSSVLKVYGVARNIAAANIHTLFKIIRSCCGQRLGTVSLPTVHFEGLAIGRRVSHPVRIGAHC